MDPKTPVCLPDDSKTRKLVEKVKLLKQKLKDAEAKLACHVGQKQACCDHSGSWEAVRKYDPFYCPKVEDVRLSGMDVFLGRRCNKCGLFEPRKEGLPIEVCYACGDIMKYDHSEPYGEHEIRVYKCQQCGHRHSTL